MENLIKWESSHILLRIVGADTKNQGGVPYQ